MDDFSTFFDNALGQAASLSTEFGADDTSKNSTNEFGPIQRSPPGALSKLAVTASPFVPNAPLAPAARVVGTPQHPPIPAIAMEVTLEQLESFRGHLLSIVSLPNGTAFIQAALRRFPKEALPMARAELGAFMKQLLFDDHASYTVRRMIEMDESLLDEFLDSAKTDHAFWIAVCNESQHSRRLLAFFLGVAPPDRLGFLFDVIIANIAELACNKNGCLALQRLISEMPPEYRSRAEEQCAALLPQLSVDPHGHYIMTYLTDHGDVQGNVQRISHLLRQPDAMRYLVCNKFGSSCVEKALRSFPAEVGGAIIQAMGALTDVELVEVANDSFGNYIVQAVVSVAPVHQLETLVARLGTLASSLTYGTKIFRCVAGAGRRATVPPQAPIAATRVPGPKGRPMDPPSSLPPRPPPQQLPSAPPPKPPPFHEHQAQQQQQQHMMPMNGMPMMYPMMPGQNGQMMPMGGMPQMMPMGGMPQMMQMGGMPQMMQMPMGGGPMPMMMPMMMPGGQQGNVMMMPVFMPQGSAKS